MRIYTQLATLLDKLLKLNESEEQVSQIKQIAIDKVEETTKSLRKAGRLQRTVMNKTTTYYIARASGVLK